MTNDTLVGQVLNKAAKKVIIVGLLAMVVGVLALVYPSGFGTVTTVVIGVFLILGGITRLGFSVFSYSMGSMFMRYLYAILMLVAGIWVVMNPEMGLEALTVVMAVYFIVDGITQFAYSFALRPVGGGMYMLLNGVLGILLGILIFSKWPSSSYFALGTYLGVKLIIDGLMLTTTGMSIRKANSELS